MPFNLRIMHARRACPPQWWLQLCYTTLATWSTNWAIIQQLNAEISKALDSKDVQERLAGVGCEAYKSTPEQFAQLVRDDLPRWARIVRESGATID